MKLSKYLYVAKQRVQCNQTGAQRVLVLGTRQAVARAIEPAIWSKIISQRFDDVPEEVLSDLYSADILVDEFVDELELVLRENDAAAANKVALYQVIQPTAQCQLGCWYCGQEHFARLMDPPTQNKVLESITRKLKAGNYRRLSISWFGAEPLIGINVIRRMTRALLQLCDDFDIDYVSKMVTNGVSLKPKLAKELVQDLRVGLIEVTLDGTAEYHNRTRHYKSGRPTFDVIFENVVHLATRDDVNPKLNIRCNVDQNNRDGFAPLFRKFASMNLQNRLNKVYAAPIYNWGNDAGDQNAPRIEYAQWEIEWMAEMFQLGYPISPLPARNKVICMAVEKEAELFDPMGNRFNCTEVSLVPGYEKKNALNVIQKSNGCGGCPKANENIFSLGHVAGEASGSQRAKLGEFNNRVRKGLYDCHECKMLPVCGGGCPKHWLEGTVPCPPTKFNIEQRLQLAYAMKRLKDADQELIHA